MGVSYAAPLLHSVLWYVHISITFLCFPRQCASQTHTGIQNPSTHMWIAASVFQHSRLAVAKAMPLLLFFSLESRCQFPFTWGGIFHRARQHHWDHMLQATFSMTGILHYCQEFIACLLKSETWWPSSYWKLVVSSFLVSKKSIIESLEFVDPPVSICKPSFIDATLG
jgi:hypothetical protein